MGIIKSLVHARNTFSHVLNQYRNKTEWEPDVPDFKNDKSISPQWWIHDYLYTHTTYQRDMFFGLGDNVQSIKHMLWQIQKHGAAITDCDDRATLACYLGLRTFATLAFRVNIPKIKHVIAVLGYPVIHPAIEGNEIAVSKIATRYIWVSNTMVSDKNFWSLSQAVREYALRDCGYVGETLELHNSAMDRVKVVNSWAVS